MLKTPVRLVAINPGGRYLALAAFHGAQLFDWRIKVIPRGDLEDRLGSARAIVDDYLTRWQPAVVAFKQIGLARSSPASRQVTAALYRLAFGRGLRVYRYSFRELTAALAIDTPLRKRDLPTVMASMHPELWDEAGRERQARNPYHVRLFEAVAVGVVCGRQFQH